MVKNLRSVLGATGFWIVALGLAALVVYFITSDIRELLTAF